VSVTERSCLTRSSFQFSLPGEPDRDPACRIFHTSCSPWRHFAKLPQPPEAVSLTVACSVGAQATNLWALRKSIQLKKSLILVFGGLLGVLIEMFALFRKPIGKR
jgi:hypothetical protein